MGPCRVQGSAWKALPSSRPPDQAGPTCPPEGSVLLTLSSGGAGLRGLRSENRGGPPPQEGRRGAGWEEHLPQARNRPSLSQLSVQSIQELGGNSFTRNQDQATPGHSQHLPPGDCPSFACVSVHLAASHLPWRVLSLAGSQVRCSLSHHLELWSWGFLITDFISSFAHHRWYQGCLQPFQQGSVSISVVISLHCGGISFSQ